MMKTERFVGLFLVAFLLGFSPGAGTALTGETDDRWLAFSGCWKPVKETTGSETSGTLLCFRPGIEDVGVQMIWVENNKIVREERFRADGRPQDANLEGCTGWKRGDFSARPGRVFLSSEHVCAGGVTRASTGLFAILSSNEWVDVQVTTVGDEKLTWVTKYQLAASSLAEVTGLVDIAMDMNMAVQSARVAASARPAVDDVIEAIGYVDAQAIPAWLVERDVPLQLNSKQLVRMADAGVPAEVIDMVVAISYPGRFVVDRQPSDYRESYDIYSTYRSGYHGSFFPYAYGSYGGWGYYGYGPLFYSRYPYGYGYGYGSPYGYGYGYGSPYGYRYGYGSPYGYGYGMGGRYYGPTITRTGPSENRGGRVINGQGYRRGGQSGATPGRSRTPSTRGAGVSRSSGGSSRGTSTGRTARRRGGGF